MEKTLRNNTKLIEMSLKPCIRRFQVNKFKDELISISSTLNLLGWLFRLINLSVQLKYLYNNALFHVRYPK